VVDPGQSILKPFLARLLLRSLLTPRERQAVLDLPFDIRQVTVHVDFVRLGETTDHSCLVVDGLVGRFEQTRKGERQITALHIPGDMADLHSVVLPKTSWALQALTASTIATIPHSALVRDADRFPALSRAFWRDCAVDASILAVGAVNLGRRDAKARVAHLLCELRYRYAAIGELKDDCLPFRLNQTQLGDVLGLTPVHVNRMLRALREAGLATVINQQAQILDWAGLQSAADFDPRYLHLMREDWLGADG
jgi:CRP-like cAMP-binding protein